MKRLFLIVAVLAISLSARDCHAQWYGHWYGWGGWGGYNWGGSTPYSNAVRAQAEMVQAQGQAAESYAKAATQNEQARSIYLDNQAKLQEMRREQRAASDARKAQQKEEAKARAALRSPPKTPAELYPRLSTDQLDPLTGEIHWPDCLMDHEFSEERAIIEQALKSQAELGPDDRTSKIIFDAATRMMSIRSPSIQALDSQGHAAYRKFLKSLSVEGDHAREALK